VLQDTIVELTRTYELRGVEGTEREAAAQALAHRFRDVLGEQAPDLFGAVDAQRQLQRNGEGVVLLIEYKGNAEELHHVVQIFSSRGGVLASATSRDGHVLVLEAFPPEGEALDKLTEAIAAAIRQVAHLRDFGARQEAARQELETGLKRALQREPNAVRSSSELGAMTATSQ
jgi:hypothetical protein